MQFIKGEKVFFGNTEATVLKSKKVFEFWEHVTIEFNGIEITVQNALLTKKDDKDRGEC